VTTINGTDAFDASVTAGRKFATAVPDVDATTAGTPVARAIPRAR
jgi:hypothetical protein